MPTKKTQPDEDEVTGDRGPTLDHRGHCTVCGGWGDHVHSTQPPKPTPKTPRAPKPDPDEPTDDDEVLVVELEPEMLAAMTEAGEVELDVDLGEIEGDGSGTALPPYDPAHPEQVFEPATAEPAPEPERKVRTQGAKRDRK